MNNITGPPVVGEDFFGREKEIEYVWKRIISGNNLIFPSPRRVGKTSFALRLLEEAKSKGWHTVSINLEKISTEQDFIEAFVNELKELSWWQKVKEKGNDIFELLKQIKVSFGNKDAKLELEWQSTKENVYKQLSALLDHNENTLIFLDELTVLLTSVINNGDSGKKNVTAFLHWLRDIRIHTGSNIKWIYCSSVGIENFTHRYSISHTMNDIHNYELKSYSKEESIEMLQILGASNELLLSRDLAKTITDKLDYCLPFFLQIIFEKIHFLVEIEGMRLDDHIVDTAYKALIEETHFNTWIERINEQYDDDKKSAFSLLKHICQANDGIVRENLVNILVASGLDPEVAEETVSRLLYMLKNDGYLMEDNRLYRFRSPLLRDFWFNRFLK